MNGYLLDTNCISELARIKPEPRVVEWIRVADENLLHLSVLTFGEIRKGATMLPAGSRRDHIETWLEKELRSRFSNRVLPIDVPVAELWGAMAGFARIKGIALAVVDGLIAATAKHHGLRSLRET
ncbi:MAG: type II toxin-antitoxin system VapC family toxin [Bryobacteraceae bacterium]